MSRLKTFFRRLRLQHLLFLLLLLPGIIPLAVSSYLLVQQNREVLETQEKINLMRAAGAMSRELSDHLAGIRWQLLQLGQGLLALPGPDEAAARLREPWVGRYFESFLLGHPDILSLRVLDATGVGLRMSPADLPPEVTQQMDTAFEQARSRREPIYRFVVLPETNEPVGVLAVPVLDEAGEPALVAEALTRLRLVDVVLEQEGRGDAGIFLIDRDGTLLWSEGVGPHARRAVQTSHLVRDFARRPLNLTAEYTVPRAGRDQRMLARVSPVDETGWGVLVHKPVAVAFAEVEQMVLNTVFSSLLLVALALLFAIVAARWVSRPIQALASTSHAIAEGEFGQRVEVRGLGAEILDLAEDFNRMSDHVESYVEQLRQAAEANRALFIGSIRSFAATIDAKDPYTRGHSERVAAVSRAVGRHIGMSEEQEYRVWIGALLHDVGKIGIEDRILKKSGLLTDEEFEEMKAHPVIGADILSNIKELKPMLPAVRWHHENWNGRGYPDGLKGEEIPVMARIVAVADTFDAVTTNRPYQRAYTTEFAVETITKLTGTRFDAKVVSAFLKAYEAGELNVRGDDEQALTAGQEAAVSS